MNPPIVLYETTHYMSKTTLSYNLKGITFNYSPFPFYKKSCQIISGQSKLIFKIPLQEKHNQKQENCFIKKHCHIILTFQEYGDKKKPALRLAMVAKQAQSR